MLVTIMLFEGVKTLNLNSRNKMFAVLISWSNLSTNWAKHFGAIMDVRKTYTFYSCSLLIVIYLHHCFRIFHISAS